MSLLSDFGNGILSNFGKAVTVSISASRPITSSDNNQILVNDSSNNTTLTINTGNPIDIVTLAQGSSGIVIISSGSGVTFTDIYGNAVTSLSSQGVGTTVTATRTGNNTYTVDVGIITNGQVPHIMGVGCNIGFLNTYEPIKFSNLVRNAAKWARLSLGSNGIPSSGLPYSYDKGRLTPPSATDEFKMMIRDNYTNFEYPSTVLGQKYTSGVNSPSTLTVRWSGIGELKVASDNGTAYTGGAWTTSPTLTVTISGGDIICIFFRGTSLTDVKAIPTVWLDYHDGTNGKTASEWSPDYVSFMQASGISTVRNMDSNDTNANRETDWTDRILITDPVWGPRAPYEVLIDLANKINADFYLNVPTRSVANHHSGLAALIASNLKSSLKAVFELSNETWNTASAFVANSQYCKYVKHTKNYATITNDGTKTIFHKTAHGLSNGNIIICFRTVADYIARKASISGTIAQGWPVDLASEVVVAVIDANSFYVTYTGTTINVASTYELNDILYVVKSEMASDLDTNYTWMCENMWTTLQTVLPRDRCIFLLGGWHTNGGSNNQHRINALTTVTPRPYDPNNTTNCDALVTAPYWNTRFWGASVVTGSTVATPRAAGANGTVTFRLYLASSAPTDQDIIDGTGAIIASGTIANSYNKSTWTSGAQFTGLTDGTQYTVGFVYTLTNASLANGYPFVIKINFTPGSVATIVQPMSMADAQTAYRIGFATFKNDILANTAIAATKGVAHMGYEGGPHNDALLPSTPAADNLEQHLYLWWKSAEYLECAKSYLWMLALAGLKRFMWYKDASTTRFGWSSNNYDSADNRYGAVKYFTGKARKYFEYPNPDANPIVLVADPVTYPHTVKTLTDLSGKTVLDSGTITNVILHGQPAYLNLSGNDLVMTSNGGLNFSTLTTVNMDINEYTSGTNLPNIYEATLMIGNPGYLDLKNYLVPQPLWQFLDKGTLVDLNQASPDNRSFLLTETAAFGKKYFINLVSQEIPAGGSFTVHLLGRTVPTSLNSTLMTIWTGTCGFYTNGTTTKVGTFTSSGSFNFDVGNNLKIMSRTFTNTDTVPHNGATDTFVLAIGHNDNVTSAVQAEIVNLYVTIP